MTKLCSFPCFFCLSPEETFLAHRLWYRKRSWPCSCSAKSFRRKAKSNLELRTEIREFITAVGLPDDLLPSLKDFVDHGRNDLANIVRRRGYKVVQDLLGNGTEPEAIDAANCGQIETDEYANGNGMAYLPSYTNGSTQIIDKVSPLASFQFVQELSDNPVENSEVKNSKIVAVDEENCQEDPKAIKTEAFETYVDYGHGKTLENGGLFNPNSANSSSIDEKVENFILTGELDSIEDDDFGILNGSTAAPFEKSEDEQLKVGSGRMKNEAFSQNGSSVSFDGSNEPSSDASCSSSSKRSIASETNRRNQVEVDHLKFMLLQKERELSILKEQIEKEKNALSSLQRKAESEIRMAQKLVSAKDAELIAAEESLSGLVEVKVQYIGDAAAVEVAGSFNGWQHRIKMEAEGSHTGGDNGGVREWWAMLWLYPGVYEIKFVVDGQWIVDHRKEVVYMDHFCNNVLRVS